MDTVTYIDEEGVQHVRNCTEQEQAEIDARRKAAQPTDDQQKQGE
jgi:hypothetical protein